MNLQFQELVHIFHMTVVLSHMKTVKWIFAQLYFVLFPNALSNKICTANQKSSIYSWKWEQTTSLSCLFSCTFSLKVY